MQVWNLQRKTPKRRFKRLYCGQHCNKQW